MMNKNHSTFYLIGFLCLPLFSCNKVDVTFADNATENDPNVSYHEDYKVDIATLKLDSFATSGHNVFMLGTHTDSSFGKISANSYAEIQLPSGNSLNGKNVVFDSLELALTPNGNFYGDTSTVFRLSVYQLAENIESNDNSRYYYPRTLAFDPVAIGQTTTTVRPAGKKELTIRLPDAIGQEWLTKFKNNAGEIQSQDKFRDYFKGICITTDSLFNNTMYYFTPPDSTLIRLHYREKGTTVVDKILQFKYITAKQFNNIRYNFTGTPFASFSSYKKQVTNSDVMAQRAYINNNIPCYTKITFPTLLSLKELYPYIKVIKAELEIRPAPGTYNYPYTLPPGLQIYVSNSDNNLNGNLQDVSGKVQNGNLAIDDLYGENTKYTFDVTNFVTAVLNEGTFSTKAILVGPASQLNDNETSRLVINEQQDQNGIKLKLYVLGL